MRTALGGLPPYAADEIVSTIVLHARPMPIGMVWRLLIQSIQRSMLLAMQSGVACK